MRERDWTPYAPCGRCGAGQGGPCRSLNRRDRRVCAPHGGRRRDHPRSNRRPRQRSRLGQICEQVMQAEGKNTADLVRMLPWSRNHLYRVLNEVRHPMTLAHAGQILAALGHRILWRAVPVTQRQEGE